MTNEDAIKILELKREYDRLHGQIQAYNSALSKIKETRELFNGLFDENEDKGVYAGITVVENKVITECQQTIKEINKVTKDIDVIAGIEVDDKVTSLEEWKMLNQ